MLDLSVTGTASRAPDRMAATLTAAGSGTNAAAAQSSLNQMVAAALHDARAVQGVAVDTSAYNVSPVYPEYKVWRAQQSLELSLAVAPESEAAKPMLKLIGQMQHDGLMLQSLTGGLSAKAQREARHAAINDAIRRLKTEAGIVAAALGDRVEGITSLHLDARPPSYPVAASAALPGAATGPSIRTAPVSEEVTLSGTVTLTPRNR